MKMEDIAAMLLHKIKSKQSSVAIVGLGYVGLPLLIQANRYIDVIGYDIDPSRIKEIEAMDQVDADLRVTSDLQEVREANVYVICVPTDITVDKLPDLSHLKESSKMIGAILSKGDVVIYESTVYPGCTEEECIPVLADGSGLTPNIDFVIGYAPERIVPGVDELALTSIPRVVSSNSLVGRQFVHDFYKIFIEADIHVAPSIKVAEAAKIVENTQRDLNISLMNELSIIFDKLDIDTQEVLDAADTKWNFHKYHPGLVGGHCISVDPFYLLYKARAIGHEPKVIAAGREINDYLPLFIAEKLENTLTNSGKTIKGARIIVYGLTFKENIDDIRNSKVIELIKELQSKGATVIVRDNHVNDTVIANILGKEVISIDDDVDYDAAIIAVKHDDIVSLGVDYFYNVLNEQKILFDLKRIIDIDQRERFQYWAL